MIKKVYADYNFLQEANIRKVVCQFKIVYIICELAYRTKNTDIIQYILKLVHVYPKVKLRHTDNYRR